MSERERIRAAIEGPVEEAAKLLDESAAGETEARLSMLINGWGRGLAAGLEELAIAVRDLRGEIRAKQDRSSAPESHHAAATPSPASSEERDQMPELADADEGQLREQAERSREATADLREKASADLEEASPQGEEPTGPDSAEQTQ